MFDFIKNLFSSPAPEQVPAPKGVRQAQIDAMTVSNTYLKKVVGEDGLTVIYNNVKYELSALYPDVQIDDNLLKELVKSSAFAEPRSEAMLKTIQRIFPNLSKKTASNYANDIFLLSRSHCDAVQSQKTGFEWYAWRACKAHQHMNNVFVRWDSPPSLELLRDGYPVPHHPISIKGCSCFAANITGVYSLREYKAPYKVCLNGKIIVPMKKKEFLEIFVEPTIKIP